MSNITFKQKHVNTCDRINLNQFLKVFPQMKQSQTNLCDYPCVFLITKLFKKFSPHLSQCNFKCSYVMEERLLQNQPNFYDYPCANDMKGIVCFLITKLFQKCFSHNSHCNFKLINSMKESFSRKFF